MAFGRKETDYIYDRFIEPLLRKKNITPVRVDRIEHLDDINNRIISELERCDFAIADLTFARPSVYYEAGYAQRSVPVIYTSRRDHFHPKPKDRFGNFKIHFDLQMKNIIPWSDKSDKNFIRRLDRRINFAIRPMIRAKQIHASESRDIIRFQKLSLVDKIDRTNTICCRLVKAKLDGFSTERKDLNKRFYPPITTDEFYGIDDFRRALVNEINILNPGWLAWGSSSGTTRAVMFRVAQSFGIRDLRQLETWISTPVYDINPRGHPKRLVEHLALCSLCKIPFSRFQSAMPAFSFDGSREEFVWATSQKIPSKRMPGFKEVYAMRNGSNFVLLGLVPGKRLKGFNTEGRRIVYRGVHSGKTKLIGYLKEVPREIHVRLFDDIKSDKYLENIFSKWLENIETTCT